MPKKSKTPELSADEEREILTQIARDDSALAITRVRAIQVLRQLEPAEGEEEENSTLLSLAELKPRRGERKGSGR